MAKLYFSLVISSLIIFQRNFLCHATSLPWNTKTLQYKVTNFLPIFNLDTYVFRAKSCDKMECQVFRRGVVIYTLEMLGSNQPGGPVTTATLNDLTGTEIGQTEVTDSSGHIECDIFKNFYVHWSEGIFLFGSGSVPHENILSSMDIGTGGTEPYDYMEMKADKSDKNVVTDIEWLPGFINGVSSIPRKELNPKENIWLFDYNDTCIEFGQSSSASTIIDFGIASYLSGTDVINIIAIVGLDTACQMDAGNTDDHMLSLYIGHDKGDDCNSKTLQQCSFTGEDNLMEKRSCRYTCTCAGNTCTSGMMHLKHGHGLESGLEVCELMIASTTF